MHTLILKKTLKGLEALRVRDPALPQRLRPAFILFDGHKSVAQVLELMPSSQGRSQLLEDVSMLIQQGLLELLRPSSLETGAVHTPSATPSSQKSGVTVQTSAPSVSGTRVKIQNPGERYMQGYTLASQLAGDLGLKGFRLQLALEKAQGYEGLVAILPRLREAIDAKKLRPLEKILLEPDA